MSPTGTGNGPVPPGANVLVRETARNSTADAAGASFDPAIASLYQRQGDNSMPGAGTDKTKRWVEQPGPVVILVEPQLGENIGSGASALENFWLGPGQLGEPW